METIHGYNIEKRNLTEDEKQRNITLARIRGFHYSAGEDFLDMFGLPEKIECFFIGYIIGRRPDLSADILLLVNEDFFFLSRLCEEIPDLGYNEDEDIDMIYDYFSDFVNLTTHLKERVNQILIQVDEHYNNP